MKIEEKKLIGYCIGDILYHVLVGVVRVSSIVSNYDGTFRLGLVWGNTGDETAMEIVMQDGRRSVGDKHPIVYPYPVAIVHIEGKY